MPKTIDDLIKCCMLDIMPPLPVIAAYFGLNNIDNLSIILGLYQGMIKIKGMAKSTVEKAYKTNQLDKFVYLTNLLEKKIYSLISSVYLFNHFSVDN